MARDTLATYYDKLRDRYEVRRGARVVRRFPTGELAQAFVDGWAAGFLYCHQLERRCTLPPPQPLEVPPPREGVRAAARAARAARAAAQRLVSEHAEDAGLVTARVANETRTAVAMYRPGPGEGWLTFCLTHGRFVPHSTRDLAAHHLSNPLGWCGVCAGSEPADESANDDIRKPD